MWNGLGISFCDKVSVTFSDTAEKTTSEAMKSISDYPNIFLQAFLSVELKPLRVGDYRNCHFFPGPRMSRNHDVVGLQPFNNFCLLMPWLEAAGNGIEPLICEGLTSTTSTERIECHFSFTTGLNGACMCGSGCWGGEPEIPLKCLQRNKYRQPEHMLKPSESNIVSSYVRRIHFHLSLIAD
jgi:hypothetical protein